MSGRRPAGGAAAPCRSGGTCSCTNIAVMQLFHELKQQFPTVPDDVVNACIVDHCHDRPACHQRLQQAAAASVPRALPYPQSHPHPRPLLITERRTEADGMTTSDINTTNLNEESTSLPPKRFILQPSVVAAPTPSERTPFLLPSDRKPPISPCTNKKFATKIQKPNYEPRVNTKVPSDNNNTCAGVNVSDLSKNFTQHCDLTSGSGTGAIKKTPPPVRPTSLDLSRRLSSENVNSVTGSPVANSVNVSVNVNCSVDLISSPGQAPGTPARRHSTVLQVTPEPVWCQHQPASCSSGMSSTASSPRSYTSVNLFLRTPTSDPQPPIDIYSSPANGLTYAAGYYNPRQGLKSQLQITVGPGNGVGTVTAVRTRPRSSYHPEDGIVEANTTTPVRAESLPDLIHRENTTAASNHVVLLSKQIERKEQLRNELEVGRERLSKIKKEVQALQLKNSPEYRTQLKKEIRHLQAQCERLTREVDRASESGGGVLLGEVNEDFYRHIYKGQRGSLHSRQNNQNQQQPQHHQQQQQPPRNTPPVADNDNESHWQCHLCTFRNHPLMDKCEQCEMPRVLLVSAGPGENIHIRFSPGNNTTRVIHSWVV